MDNFNPGKIYFLPKKILFYYIVKLLLIIALISLIGIFSGGVQFWFTLFYSLAITLGPIIFFALYLDYKCVSFEVYEDKITINSGVFIKRSKTILFNNIQNVNIVSGPLMGMFNLSKIEIWTSSPGQINLSNSHQRNAGESHTPDGFLLLPSDQIKLLRDFITIKRD